MTDPPARSRTSFRVAVRLHGSAVQSLPDCNIRGDGVGGGSISPSKVVPGISMVGRHEVRVKQVGGGGKSAAEHQFMCFDSVTTPDGDQAALYAAVGQRTVRLQSFKL